VNEPLQTGDLVCLRHVKPGLYARAIELMGGVSHHNELVRVGRRGAEGAEVLYVHHPHAEYIPFSDRILQYASGDILMAAYRHRGLDSEAGALATLERMAMIGGALDAMAALRLPYDWRGIVSFARNQVREWLRLRRVIAQSEHRVWCSESCEIAYDIAGLDIIEGIPAQPLVAPIHVERTIRAGTYRLVADFGLDAMIRR
jgi:hypothetical protein